MCKTKISYTMKSRYYFLFHPFSRLSVEVRLKYKNKMIFIKYSRPVGMFPATQFWVVTHRLRTTAVELYDFSTFSRKETSCWFVCNSCNAKFSDSISCIGDEYLLFGDILLSVVSLPKSTRSSCAQGTASCPVIRTSLWSKRGRKFYM
jgi:hypothetical protein